MNGTEFTVLLDEEGMYQLEVTAQRLAQSQDAERTVNIDLTPPTLTLRGDSPLTLRRGTSYVELGATADDNVDGDISDQIVISGSVDARQSGTYEIRYNVTDSSGNAAEEVVRTVHVVNPPSSSVIVDTTPPTLTLNGEEEVILEVGEPYTELGATAVDNVDGDISDHIEISGEVDSEKPGIYEVVYTVADQAGNKVTVIRKVEVISFSDVAGHWAQDKINKWAREGWINGFKDGTFRPDNVIRRVEFMAMVNRSFGFTQTADIHFTDVADGAWYVNDIRLAIAAGYIQGFEDGTVRPRHAMTREELAVVMMLLLDLELNTNHANLESFKDSAFISSRNRGAVSAVVDQGYMVGYEDANGAKTFRPHNKITRAEAVVTLNRALNDRFTRDEEDTEREN